MRQELTERYTHFVNEQRVWHFEVPGKRYFHKLTIIFAEVWANVTHVLPNFLKWEYRLYVSKELTSVKLTATVQKIKKTGYLYTHKPLKEKTEPEGSPVLFLHGDFGHPFTTLNLADLALKLNRPVFSLFIRSQHAEIHSALLKQAIDKIQEVTKDFKKITTVGHSKGAILSAHTAYVIEEPRIEKVISLAGRLRVIEPSDKPCRKDIKPIVDAIYEGIQKNPNPPLYVIAGDQDWNAPQEAMFVRDDPANNHVEKGATHLNILYRKGTEKAFVDFLQRPVAIKV